MGITLRIGDSLGERAEWLCRVGCPLGTAEGDDPRVRIRPAVEGSALTRTDHHLSSRSMGVESSVEANDERLHALPEPKLKIMNVGAGRERANCFAQSIVVIV